MVKATTIVFKAGMMVTPKPTFVVLVTATISLTIVGPVPLCLLGLLTSILILPILGLLLGALLLLPVLVLLLGALLLLPVLVSLL